MNLARWRLHAAQNSTWQARRLNLRESPALLTAFMILVSLAAGVGAGILSSISPLAGFVLVVAVAIGVTMLTNALMALMTLVGIIYVLPFGVIPVPIGGVKFTFIDAAMSLTLLLWLLRILTRREDRLITSPIDGPLTIFMVLAIACFIFGIYSVTGEVTRFFFKSINSMLFFFSVTNIVRKRQQLTPVVKTVIWGGFAAAALALGIYLLPATTAERLLSTLRVVGYPSGSDVLRYIASTETLRAIGTSIDPNVLGGMLLVVLPLTVASLFGRKALLPRPFLAVAFVTMVLALILTYSRSSWVGALAAMLFMGTVRYRRLWILFAVFLALLFVLPQGDIVLGRIGSGIAAEDQAAQMRLGEYKDALRLISQYPWFGVGFGSAPSIDLYVAASSIYLLIAEEMGLVGLSVFLLTMVVLFVYALSGLKRIADPLTQTIQLGAMASLVGALTAGLFDHYFFNLHFPHTVALFWLFVGLVVVATRLGTAEEKA